jgi:hypothetical protein
MALTLDSVGAEPFKVGRIDDPIWHETPVSRPPQSGHQWLPIAAVLLILAVTLGAGSASVLSRRDFGTFAFWRLPLRINYCGRRYYQEGTAQGSPASLAKLVAGHPRWQTVGHTFSLRQIDAVVSPSTDHSSVCTMTVDVPTGNRRYAQYVLSGGP